MGTNYYWCENSTGRRFHIGKSSFGWCFALHIYPEAPCAPTDLDEWLMLFFRKDTKIVDEYGEAVSPLQMMEIIINRRHKEPNGMTEEELNQNTAVRGPKNLLRSKIDNNHCIGHGSGTWDLIIGNFT
jgi:hypothetical protein